MLILNQFYFRKIKVSKHSLFNNLLSFSNKKDIGKKKEKDSKSAELGQVDSSGSSSIINGSNDANIKSINTIDQVGK